MGNPIGISFIPSADNQAAQGSRQANFEGDLASAFKVLSLQLPKVLGASSIAAPDLLKSPGASGVQGAPAGTNPAASVFQALLAAANGGATPSTSYGSDAAAIGGYQPPTSQGPTAARMDPSGATSVPAPRIIAQQAPPPDVSAPNAAPTSATNATGPTFARQGLSDDFRGWLRGSGAGGSGY